MGYEEHINPSNLSKIDPLKAAQFMAVSDSWIPGTGAGCLRSTQDIDIAKSSDYGKISDSVSDNKQGKKLEQEYNNELHHDS